MEKVLRVAQEGLEEVRGDPEDLLKRHTVSASNVGP